MRRYRGVVVFRYYQELEVEADSQDDAERIMCEEFRLDKADGECEVYDMEEVRGEVEADQIKPRQTDIGSECHN